MIEEDLLQRKVKKRKKYHQEAAWNWGMELIFSEKLQHACGGCKEIE